MTAARKPRPVTRIALPLIVIERLIREHAETGTPITWDELVEIARDRKPRRGELPEILDVRSFEERLAEWAEAMRVAAEQKRARDMLAFDDEAES